MKCFLCDFMGWDICEQFGERGLFIFLQKSQPSNPHEVTKKNHLIV